MLLSYYFWRMSSPTNHSGFFKRLQIKWRLESLFQLGMVLLAFACTGTTILLIKKPILDFFGIERGGDQDFLNTILYLILILPLYQIFLLIYGFLFGQFQFFWQKEKQLVRKILSLFPPKK